MMRDDMTQATRVAVSAGSKHGATVEIASRIAEVLAGRGHDVSMKPPEAVVDPTEYDAIVLGSSIYAGHWQSDAKALAERIGCCDPVPLVWLFSSGPVGDPPKPEEDPVDVAGIIETTSALSHKVFAGKLDTSQLTFGERAVVGALRAPKGDFRDWDEISNWAEVVADELGARSVSMAEPPTR
jgi:menaquinone-dependent protoporphyrinogen oxidase